MLLRVLTCSHGIVIVIVLIIATSIYVIVIDMNLPLTTHSLLTKLKEGRVNGSEVAPSCIGSSYTFVK